MCEYMNPSDILINIFAIAFLLFVNGFFVAAEFSLVKVRRTRLEQLSHEGSNRAKKALKLVSETNKMLAEEPTIDDAPKPAPVPEPEPEPEPPAPPVVEPVKEEEVKPSEADMPNEVKEEVPETTAEPPKEEAAPAAVTDEKPAPQDNEKEKPIENLTSGNIIEKPATEQDISYNESLNLLDNNVQYSKCI